MEILNIGIPEMLLILVLMLILLGPEGMSKTARTLAREVRKIIRSPLWSDLMKTQRDIQDLPQRLVREAGIEDLSEEVRKINQEVSQHIQLPYQTQPAGDLLNQSLPPSDLTNDDPAQSLIQDQADGSGLDQHNQPEPPIHYPQIIAEKSTIQDYPAEDKP